MKVKIRKKVFTLIIRIGRHEAVKCTGLGDQYNFFPKLGSSKTRKVLDHWSTVNSV